MSIRIEETNQWLYEISYILNKPKFDSRNYELGYWMKHNEVQRSKRLGWYCELCGARSTPPKNNYTYKHTLIKRVKWHLNGRCPAEKERAKMAVIPL